MADEGVKKEIEPLVPPPEEISQEDYVRICLAINGKSGYLDMLRLVAQIEFLQAERFKALEYCENIIERYDSSEISAVLLEQIKAIRAKLEQGTEAIRIVDEERKALKEKLSKRQDTETSSARAGGQGIKGIERKLRSLFGALLDARLEYMPSGGMWLDVSYDGRPVAVVEYDSRSDDFGASQVGDGFGPHDYVGREPDIVQYVSDLIRQSCGR